MIGSRSIARTLYAVGAAILLSALQGCFLSPGKFESSLDIRKDGRFTFAYDGEMHFLALSDFAGRDSEFEPEECRDDEFELRECTDAEIDAQRQAWAEKQEREKKEAKEMASLFGGIDPSDPAAAEELAAALRKQKGWQHVEYKGDGLFDVSYRLSSHGGHPFAFPALEGFPVANAFVQIAPRADGSLRIDAPGFGPAGGYPMSSMLFGAAGMSGSGADDLPKLPELGGVFTITTDGQILANNTDEGGQPVDGSESLSWSVSRTSRAAPMALIRLGN